MFKLHSPSDSEISPKSQSPHLMFDSPISNQDDQEPFVPTTSDDEIMKTPENHGSAHLPPIQTDWSVPRDAEFVRYAMASTAANHNHPYHPQSVPIVYHDPPSMMRRAYSSPYAYDSYSLSHTLYPQTQQSNYRIGAPDITTPTGTITPHSSMYTHSHHLSISSATSNQSALSGYSMYPQTSPTSVFRPPRSGEQVEEPQQVRPALTSLPMLRNRPSMTIAERRAESRGSGNHHPAEKKKAKGERIPRKRRLVGVKRKMKYSRTRSGCLCCRQRRVKCDEGKPACQKCSVGNRTCEYPAQAGYTMRRSTKPPKKKGGRARKRTPTPVFSEENEFLTPSDTSDAEYFPSGIKSSTRQKRSSKVSRKEDDSIEDSPESPLLSLSSTQGDILNVTIPSHGHTNWYNSFVPSNTGIGLGLGFGLPVIGGSEYQLPEALEVDQHQKEIEETVRLVGIQAGVPAQDIPREEQGADVTPLISTPEFLQPWFPTPEERSLFMHYCVNASNLMMAIPSLGVNPMLSINLPLALDSPRGSNVASDALRISLLGIGAIHKAFLSNRSGVQTHETAAMFQYASSLRDTGKEMVKRAISTASVAQPRTLLRDSEDQSKEVEAHLADGTLGAAMALSSIDIFFGGKGWEENFNLAKEMVKLRGGPANMLRASKPRILPEGETLTPARLMLETLGIYEIFGCLTSGEAPTLITDDWWFAQGKSTYQKVSVENAFGLSRVMVHLFSRLVKLLSKTASASSPSEISPTLSAQQYGIKIDRPYRLAPELEVLTDAKKLLMDVETWIQTLSANSMDHDRIQVGNRAYAYAMKIILLRRTFKRPRLDIQIQHCASEVLKHCSTSTAVLGMSIDLTWPAIVAGCCLPLEPVQTRRWLINLFESFKAQCCFDVDTASRIVLESWKRIDMGDEARGDWKEVCDDLGLKVLIC